MPQGNQPPSCRPEEIPRATGVNALLGALIHFRDPRRPRRLRNRILVVLLLAATLNTYLWSRPTVSISIGWTLFTVLLCAAAIAYVMKELLARRIDGNVYREAPVGIAHRFATTSALAAVIILTYNSSLRRWVLTSPALIVIPVAFLFGTILSLAWLIGYEKRNGPVLIVEETPREST